MEDYKDIIWVFRGIYFICKEEELEMAMPTWLDDAFRFGRIPGRLVLVLLVASWIIQVGLN